MSRGSTEPRALFEAIDNALGLGLAARTKQGMAREIVERAGARWDATYESAGATVTLQGLLAVADAVEALAPAPAPARREGALADTATDLAPERVFADYPGWAAAAAVATPAELALIEAVAPLAAAGVEAPTVGDEVLDGLPLSIAWPARRVAVRWDDLDDDALEALRAAGWALVDPTAAAIRLAL